MHIVSHVECDNEIKGQYVNVCVNGDNDLPPSEPLDSESSDLESELENLTFDNINKSTTYH